MALLQCERMALPTGIGLNCLLKVVYLPSLLSIVYKQDILDSDDSLFFSSKKKRKKRKEKSKEKRKKKEKKRGGRRKTRAVFE